MKNPEQKVKKTQEEANAFILEIGTSLEKNKNIQPEILIGFGIFTDILENIEMTEEDILDLVEKAETARGKAVGLLAIDWIDGWASDNNILDLTKIVK